MFPIQVYATLWLLILVPLAVMFAALACDDLDLRDGYRYGAMLVAASFAVLVVLGFV